MDNRNKRFTLKDGRKLGFIEYGDPDGKPLFFFHGWPGSRYSGKETDEAAKKLRVRVISTDRPGMGVSDYQEGRKLLDWPDDVVQLADHLGIKKFSIMGVSGGGPYVAACAYKIPERIIKAGIVVGLAPVNIKGNLAGMAIPNRLSWASYHRFPIIRTMAAFIAATEYRYLPLLGSLFGFPTKEDRDIFNSFKESVGKESGIKEAFRQGIKGAATELRVYTDDWGFKVKDIKAKVYLWYGVKDKCVGLNMARYYKSHISKSTLFIDQDGGHLARYNFEEKIVKTLTNYKIALKT